MRTFAPGKLVLTGAYAVLEGAPAISVAVSAGAYADASRSARAPTPEVRAALGDDVTPPSVDASAMFLGGRKLGIGASAAILVASLAALEAAAGADPSSPAVRAELFARARRAHAAAQRGGSGVDVATSVYGGAIQYVVDRPVKRVVLPSELKVQVFACGASAQTSALRAEVDRLALERPSAHRASMDDLGALARAAAGALDAGDGPAFVESLQETARALARLGAAAKTAIVPDGFEVLEQLAAREEAAFSVSGAGGGDVAVHVGPSRPSPAFLERARELGLLALKLSIDHKGVRTAPTDPAFAAVEGASDQR